MDFPDQPDKQAQIAATMLSAVKTEDAADVGAALMFAASSIIAVLAEGEEKPAMLLLSAFLMGVSAKLAIDLRTIKEQEVAGHG